MLRRSLGVPLVLLFAFGCSTPVGVRVAKPQEVHRYLTRSVLTTGKPSLYSEIVLRRHGLLDAYEDDPEGTLERLHEASAKGGFPSDELFALSELWFVRGDETEDAGQFGAAAVYAYTYLFPEDGREPGDPLDPRQRVAADLYNRAVTRTLKRSDDGDVVLRPGGLSMPIGHIKRLGGSVPELGGYALEGFYPVGDLDVRGLRNRYRRPGIGAPLAGRLAPTQESESQPVPLSPSSHMPLTATVRLPNPLAQLRAKEFEGWVDYFPSLDVETVEINGRPVTLEAEPTAVLAAALTESQFWRQELSAFMGDLLGVRSKSNLTAMRPYQQNRVPVVFVHGTASSPARWVNMANDLLSDKSMRHRYAFWFFSYDSGNPIAYSGWRLRDHLQQAVQRADPESENACLRDMVVLGHSQGGLLTKLTSIDSGSAFWDQISDEPLEESRFSDANKELLGDALFVEPLPFVRRVIFLATPHRGSYLAGPKIVRRLAQYLIRMPSDLVRLGPDLAGMASTGSLSGQRLPTSIDNMSPGAPFIKVMAEIPVDPRVTAHSIIAVNGDGPLEEESDGVVKYSSAHVEGVESELVVHSPHSGMQDRAETVEEVRRILLAHAETSPCDFSVPSVAPDVPAGAEASGGQHAALH